MHRSYPTFMHASIHAYLPTRSVCVIRMQHAHITYTHMYIYCAGPIVRPTSLHVLLHIALHPLPRRLLAQVKHKSGLGPPPELKSIIILKRGRNYSASLRRVNDASRSSATPQEPVCKMIDEWVETFGPVMYIYIYIQILMYPDFRT